MVRALQDLAASCAARWVLFVGVVGGLQLFQVEFLGV